MIALPTPAKLASLVSNITETMLGIAFQPAEPHVPHPGLVWRTAVLPIPGAQPLTVGLSSDKEGCSALAGAMFAVPVEAVDSTMMNDALCELVNMTAGLVKGTLKLDQPLGLPRVLSETDGPLHSLQQEQKVTFLQAKNSLGLLLWIVEGVL